MRTVDPVRHSEKRGEILDAARRCFARDGLRGASMSSICAEAGISPGHLYHYFDGKDAIVSAITLMVLDDIAADYARTMQSSDALAALISDAMLDIVRERPSAHVLIIDMLADADRNAGLASILQDYSARMQTVLANFLREGQAHRRIDPSLDPAATAAIIIALVDGVKMMGVRHPDVDRPKAIAMLHTLLLRFLTPPAPPSTAQSTAATWAFSHIKNNQMVVPVDA